MAGLAPQFRCPRLSGNAQSQEAESHSRTRFENSTGSRKQGGSRGADIVDKQQVLAVDFPRPYHSEDILSVLYSLITRKGRLSGMAFHGFEIV